jgi:CRISPR-associated endonuclease Csn1
MSTKLFRLQAMTKKSNNQFVVDFRHHLETQTLRKINGKGIDELPLKSIIWEQISKNSDISRLTKIRINQLGDIIKIGE